MRGIHVDSELKEAQEGIIPAHAGHTLPHTIEIRLDWDHPRTCGAYISSADVLAAAVGSSPHMRGIRLLEV